MANRMLSSKTFDGQVDGRLGKVSLFGLRESNAVSGDGESRLTESLKSE